MSEVEFTGDPGEFDFGWVNEIPETEKFLMEISALEGSQAMRRRALAGELELPEGNIKLAVALGELPEDWQENPEAVERLLFEKETELSLRKIELAVRSI